MRSFEGYFVDPSTGEITNHDVVNERKYREASDPCAHAKESRRHHIIAGGHGGRNGFTDYKPHKEC
ncbi:MAG: hypothetical protein [Microvirus sp.]|nr:MAG: hypothetical protein [Microvirus sp.]